MDTIIAVLKAANLEARKAKDATTAAALTTLVSECEAVGKKEQRSPTDVECVAKIKAAIKNAQTTLEAAQADPSRATAVSVCVNEIALYSSFLPQQMTEEDIVSVFDEISPKNMGEMMAYMKKNYAGQYDGALAAKVCASRL